jgi:hypothetical protein
MSGGKKEKEPKRKKRGLWKMTPLWKSTKNVDSHRGLEKPAGFSTFPHRPGGDKPLTIKQRGGSVLLDQGGSLLRCQNDSACLRSVFWLQRGLLCLGVRTRGGIAFGRLFHRRDMVFGEGLVRAYRLESEIAIYPRAVIDDKIIDILLSDPIPSKLGLFENRMAHLIRVDDDGRYFVDYLGYDPIGANGLLHRELINIYRETTQDLAFARGNMRLAAKLEWLHRYLWASVVNIDEQLKVNRGTKFGERFPRTTENLSTLLERLEAQPDSGTKVIDSN